MIKTFVATVVAGAIQGPIRTMLMGVAVCGIVAAGLGGLKLNASYNAYFDPQDPVLANHRSLQDTYSITDGLLVIVQFGDSIVFGDSALRLLKQIVAGLESLPSVKEVKSILDLGTTEEDDFDELDAEILDLTGIESDNDRSEEGVVRLDIDKIIADPRAPGLLFSRDKTSLALDIRLDLPENLPAPILLETLSGIRTTLQQELSATAATFNVRPQIRISGPLALNEAYISVIRHDLRVFLPTLVISMLVMLWLVFGSFKIAIISLSIAGVSILSAFGAAGWLGFELAAIDAFAPVIIASIALAGTVHILNAFADSLNAGTPRQEAIIAAVEDNAFPLALTMLTTTGGFLALAFSPSPPIRVMGYIVSFGILFAWIAISLMLPAMLKVSSARPSRAAWVASSVELLYEQSIRRSKLVVGIIAALAVIAIFLVGENQINDNVFEYFPSSHQFRADAELVRDKFSGVNPALFSIQSSLDYGALDTELLSAVDAFQVWLGEQPEVRKTLAMTDFAKVRENLLNRELNDLARYRELAKLHTPNGLGIEQLVDGRYRSLAVHVYLDSLDANEQINFDEKAKAWFLQAYPSFSLSSGGTSLVFAHLGQRNATSMVYALTLALIGISFICIFLLRSTYGLWIGLLCNLFPLLVVYAVWAIFDGKISIGGAVVIGMILGIVVDDTLYLLARFRRTSSDKQAQPHRRAVLSVGPALVITSLTLIVGLAAGLMSDFAPIRAMSGLSMSIIFVAVLTDICVLSIVFSRLSKRTEGV